MRDVLPKTGGRTPRCFCGRCLTCRARRRKEESRDVRVTRDWRLWSEVYRWAFFRSVWRDLLGPNANLSSPLGKS